MVEVIATTSMATNTTAPPLDCNQVNPWYGIYGTQRIIEIVYLTLLIAVGSLGNFIIIFSILLVRKTHQKGNAFVINLAICDLIVTGAYAPTVLANVIKTENALPGKAACDAMGYIFMVTASCSMCNLAFIALNRYWAVVRHDEYGQVFSKRGIYVMIAFTWVWSNIIAVPTLLGWSDLGYNAKMMECTWVGGYSASYDSFLAITTLIIPIGVILFCYWHLFKYVRKRGDWLRRQESPSLRNNNHFFMNSSYLKREVDLLKTLAASIIAFLLCWGPLGVTVLLPIKCIDKYVMKIFAWLALSNSTMNFIIYGAMHKPDRERYKMLFSYIFACKTCNRFVRLISTIQKARHSPLNRSSLNKNIAAFTLSHKVSQRFAIKQGKNNE